MFVISEVTAAYAAGECSDWLHVIVLRVVSVTYTRSIAINIYNIHRLTYDTVYKLTNIRCTTMRLYDEIF